MLATTTEAIPAKEEFEPLNFILFLAIVLAAIVGIPLYGYFFGFSLFDWMLFLVMYIVTGMGITVGYHRLVSHQSFECPNWVKGCILVAGGWALQNSALKWGSDHIRHHAKTDEEEDPYNATKGFWHSHCGWLFTIVSTGRTNTRSVFVATLSSYGRIAITGRSWSRACYSLLFLVCGTAAGREASAASSWAVSSGCSWC